MRRGAIDSFFMVAAEARHLGSLLARSFYDDPFARWVEPDDSTRLTSLTRQFEFLYALVFVHRRIIDVAGDPPIAQAIWAPPGTWQFGEAENDALERGFAEILGARMDSVGRAFAAIDEFHPLQLHWYLDFLGVDPDEQGCGHGGALLAQGLRRCDAARQAAYLWTANERNLAFYQRYGFTVAWEDVVADAGPRVWGLWRPPHAQDPVGDLSPADQPSA